jgi:hypothetical protein
MGPGAGSLRTSVAETKLGIEAARTFVPPAREAWLRRFAYGATLPLAVARAVSRDGLARRRWLSVATTQALVVWGVSLGLTLLSKSAVARLHEGWERGGLKIVSDGAFAFWSTLYATLVVVEWIVVALSRDHHDAIGSEASRLTGVPPEEDERAPRVALNVGWMIKRAKRYIRGLRVWLLGLPLLGLVAVVPVAGAPLYGLLVVAWAAYWLAVFNVAKSELAWRREPEVIAHEVEVARGAVPDRGLTPSYMRWFGLLTERVPGFRWWLPRWYGRLWRRWSRSAFPACLTAESVPWEAAGLALARILSGVPGLYMFVRPLIPVAAAHAILAPERREPV